MLEAVLRHTRNWFVVERLRGAFAVEGGSIGLPDGYLADGQYFRVVGSVFNDGLHKWPATDLKDEQFAGSVQALAIPAAVEELASDIAAWCEKYRATAETPYQSESFGGYTYSKSGDSDGCTWQAAFKTELSRWRKL
jgi:hypothetical protein